MCPLFKDPTEAVAIMSTESMVTLYYNVINEPSTPMHLHHGPA